MTRLALTSKERAQLERQGVIAGARCTPAIEAARDKWRACVGRAKLAMEDLRLAEQEFLRAFEPVQQRRKYMGKRDPYELATASPSTSSGRRFAAEVNAK